MSVENEIVDEKMMKELVKHLPQPRGYSILVRIFEDINEFLRNEKGDKTCLIKPEDFNLREKYRHNVGLVLALGQKAYSEEPSEPWCKVNETVMIDRYKSKPFLYDGVPYAFCPDNAIIGTVPDAGKIKFI